MEVDQTLPQSPAPGTERHNRAGRGGKLSPVSPDPIGPAQRSILAKLAPSRGRSVSPTDFRNLSPARSLSYQQTAQRGRQTERPSQPNKTHSHSRCCKNHKEEAANSKKKLTDLRIEYLSLKSEVEGIRDAKDSMIKSLQQQLSANNHNQQAAESAAKLKSDHKKDLDALGDEISQLKAAKDADENQFREQLKQAQESHASQLKTMQDETLRNNNIHEEEMSKVQKQLSLLQEKYEHDLEEIKNQNIEQIADLNSRISELENDVTREGGKASELELELSETRQAVSEAEERLQGYQTELHSKDEQLAAAESHLECLHQEHSQQVQTLRSEHTTQIDTLQQQHQHALDSLTDQLSAAESSLKAQQQHANDLRDKLSDKESSLAALEEEVNVTHGYNHLLEERNEDIQKRLTKMEERLATATERERQQESESTRKIDELTSEVDSLKESEGELMAQNERTASLLQSLQEKCDTYEEKLTDAEREEASMRNELEVLKQKSQDAESLAIRCEELESENNERQRAAEELGSKNDGLAIQLEELTFKKSELESERRRLLERVNGLEVGQQELAQLQARLRTDNQRLSSELTRRSATPFDPDTAKQGAMGLDLDANTLVITRVIPGGPSHTAGMKKGDKIIGIKTETDDVVVPIECVHVLRSTLSIAGGVSEGSTIDVVVVRKGMKITYQLRLVRDDGSVANTTKRHLKGLRLDYPHIDINKVTKLATSEAHLHDELLNHLGNADHLPIEAVHSSLQSFNTSLGIPLYSAATVNKIYPRDSYTVTPYDLFPQLKTVFYSSLRALELGTSH
eukprot:TRINITY_DN11661_c0_g1_i1.p1 TRINITY_DN11661_c0_g1~~TRINITY_DN11661_c0_g1_i1.p1  ORF type:complete len:803 (+),score=196.58 TRINITY_DN11661_c0_g1_i1:56-2464(+)